MTYRLLPKYFATSPWKTTCKLVYYWLFGNKCTCPLVPKHQSWVLIGTFSIAIWWPHRQSTLAVAIALLLLSKCEGSSLSASGAFTVCKSMTPVLGSYPSQLKAPCSLENCDVRHVFFITTGDFRYSLQNRVSIRAFSD